MTLTSKLIYLGIDPGDKGGISVHNGSDITAYAFTRCTPADIYHVFKDVSGGDVVALIERVASSPQMGRASAFKFGEGYGFLRGLLTALEIPFEYVAPVKWQRYLKCKTGLRKKDGTPVRDKQGRPKHDKNITKRKAQELFPYLKITHAISDALLIGEYHKRTYYANNFEMEL